MPGTKQILIADDDRALREALAARLSLAGFEVLCAPDGRSAIELFERHHPDAAVLDVQMPESDGFSVCEHIRKSDRHIPIFILTGAREGIIRNHLRSLTSAVQANHFVAKPYDGKALIMMIRGALSYGSGAAGSPNTAVVAAKD